MHKKSAKSHRLSNSRQINGTQSLALGGSQIRSHLVNNNNNNNNNNHVNSNSSNGFDRSEFTWRTSNGHIHNHKSRSTSSMDNQTEQGSWLEDAENAAAHRTLEHWALVDRTLCDEDDQLHPGPLFDECMQWKNQLPHLRVVGRSLFENSEEKNCTVFKTDFSVLQKRRQKSATPKISDQGDEFINIEQHYFSKEPSIHSLGVQNLKQAKEEVLDHIVEFICKELTEIEAEKQAEVEEEEDLSGSFDDFLKIVPAPTVTGKNPLISNNFYYNVDNAGTLSPTKDESTSKEFEKNKDFLQGRRNKQGMIFNERVIVSPVPFVLSTKESFSTLTQTPIYYGTSFDTSENIHSGSRFKENTRKKKTPLISVAPHVQSMWNTPVCPTVWPKNVKLTPIDTSRLPSSKKRASKTAESIPPRRNHNSLSPISHLIQPNTPRMCAYKDNHLEGLEVRGSHIEAHRMDSQAAKTARLSRVKHA